MLPQYSSAIVGNSDLMIHSQIAARLLTRYLAGIGELRRAIDEENLDGLKEVARRIADPVLGFTAVAKLRAQFRQDDFGARHVLAVDLHPLDFDEQIPACLRRYPPKILLDPVDLGRIVFHCLDGLGFAPTSLGNAGFGGLHTGQVAASRNIGASTPHRALPRSQTRPSTMPFDDR